MVKTPTTARNKNLKQKEVLLQSLRPVTASRDATINTSERKEISSYKTLQLTKNMSCKESSRTVPSSKTQRSARTFKETLKLSLVFFISFCFVLQTNIAKPLAETI